jgi:hypothetical protein
MFALQFLYIPKTVSNIPGVAKEGHTKARRIDIIVVKYQCEISEGQELNQKSPELLRATGQHRIYELMLMQNTRTSSTGLELLRMTAMRFVNSKRWRLSLFRVAYTLRQKSTPQVRSSRKYWTTGIVTDEN